MNAPQFLRLIGSLPWLILILCTLIEVTVASEEHGNDADPFLGLHPPKTVKSRQPKADSNPAERPSGLLGLLVAETSLIGVVTSGELSLAILEGVDQSTHIARTGTRLFDGWVTAISRTGIYFTRDRENSNRSPTIFKPLPTESRR